MDLNVLIALGAGFASFISPCCLPLYPSYLSYITGISVTRLQAENNTREVRALTMAHTLFFIAGFSVVFYTLGSVAGFVAELFKENRQFISQMAAILIFLMGLMMLGVFQPKWLLREKKWNVKTRSIGYLGSFLLGIGFAAGWSPCVGPILSSILLLAASQPGTWFTLITAYTVGFAIPFFILAFFIGSARRLLKYSNLIMKVGGAVLIVISVLMYTGQMIRITVWFNSITPEWLRF